MNKIDPKSISDYRKIIQSLTKRPMKLICVLTGHWKPDWYIQMASECKEKDPITQAKICNRWLRDARLINKSN